MTVEHAVHRLWHAHSADEAMAAYESRRDGLADEEVAARRRVFGPNVLPPPRRPGLVLLYVRQFASPLIYLLLAAAGVSLAIGKVSDALFIFAVLQINAVIGALQERKAESSAEALDTLVRTRAVVRRRGHRVLTAGADLVPGDIVLLESGNLVPADVRLLAGHELKVDESLLTGESLPVGKDSTLVLAEACPLGDRRNMLHAGTTVLSGRAEGIVTKTGVSTEVGRISATLAQAPALPPPLILRLHRFSRAIGAAIVAAVAVLAAAQIAQGTALADIFFVAVALAVSAIPEGLPVAITITLSVASVRMARRNVIVRSLPAVEGLGACTLIASDKTGTLTCNELTIRRLWLPGVGHLEVSGEGYVPHGDVRKAGRALDEAEWDRVRRLATAGALCNEASFRATEGGYRHLGDTVDVAFLVFAAKAGLDRDALRRRFPPAAVVPFESARRFAANVNRDGDGFLAHVKGATEVVLPMCAAIDGEQLVAETGRLAADGYRVIAVAAGEIEEPAVGGFFGPDRLRGLEFLGLVGLIDPLRPEVPAAVTRCRRAGVDVAMVTGDHPVTAFAIARDLGIAADPAVVVTGAELAELAGNAAALDATVAEARVYARVEPLQKLTIVQALQRRGHFVAVTGDGVNDAPALRAAHIGVAMGREGTDVARGAADLILTDDNFASIVGGIEEGRIAYDNVRKVIYLLISSGAAEIVVFFLAMFAGLPLPLFAAQLLWLNLVTDGIQHIALSFEKGEPGILERPPRPPRQSLFDRRMVEQTAISGLFIGGVAFLFFWWMLVRGVEETAARNALLLLMVFFENAHVFNCRSERHSTFTVALSSNPFLPIAVLGAQGVHIGAMYVPGLRDVLAIHPIDLATWLSVAPLGLGLIAVMELYKAVRRAWPETEPCPLCRPPASC